jgi:hypothetical protein
MNSLENPLWKNYQMGQFEGIKYYPNIILYKHYYSKFIIMVKVGIVIVPAMPTKLALPNG